MRIIFLNISGGHFLGNGSDFFDAQLAKTDVFCFSEVYPDLHKGLSRMFTGFNNFYKEGGPSDYMDGKIDGQSIFLRKKWKISAHERYEIFKISRKDIGILQFISFKKGNSIINIGNIHGMAFPGEKTDTSARIEQSEKIINYFNYKKGPKIIGGDFNLLPETKSVKMFEKAGYRNLIKEFDIKSTRNKVGWEQFKNDPGFVKQYFADYVFVSPEVKVKNFEVPDIEVSDHLPLILDFDFSNNQY